MVAVLAWINVRQAALCVSLLGTGRTLTAACRPYRNPLEMIAPYASEHKKETGQAKGRHSEDTGQIRDTLYPTITDTPA